MKMECNLVDYYFEELNESNLIDAENLYKNVFDVLEANYDDVLKSFSLIKNDCNYFAITVRCKKSSKVVAFGLGVRNHFPFDTTKPMFLVWGVCVDKNLQKKGIGKALMATFENKGKELGCDSIWLFSGEQRRGAHQFYKSIGYECSELGFIKMI